MEIKVTHVRRIVIPDEKNEVALSRTETEWKELTDEEGNFIGLIKEFSYKVIED